MMVITLIIQHICARVAKRPALNAFSIMFVLNVMKIIIFIPIMNVTIPAQTDFMVMAPLKNARAAKLNAQSARV